MLQALWESFIGTFDWFQAYHYAGGSMFGFDGLKPYFEAKSERFKR